MRGCLREHEYTYLIISRSVLLRMRNVSDKSCRGYQNTHFIYNNFFFFLNLAVREIMWKNKEWPKKMYTHFDMKSITL